MGNITLKETLKKVMEAGKTYTDNRTEVCTDEEIMALFNDSDYDILAVIYLSENLMESTEICLPLLPVQQYVGADSSIVDTYNSEFELRYLINDEHEILLTHEDVTVQFDIETGVCTPTYATSGNEKCALFKSYLQSGKNYIKIFDDNKTVDTYSIVHDVPYKIIGIDNISDKLYKGLHFNSADITNFYSENLNFEELEHADYLFADSGIDCSDMDKKNMLNLKSVKAMFKNVQTFNDLVDFAPRYNFNNITNVDEMFSGSNVKYLDLSNCKIDNPQFDSFQIIDSTNTNLECLAIDGINFSNVNTMFDMSGSYARELTITNNTGIGDPNFITNVVAWLSSYRGGDSKVFTLEYYKPPGTSISGIFNGAIYADELNVPYWDVSEVTDMSYAFQDVSFYNVTVDLNNWDVSNVTNMNSMFKAENINNTYAKEFLIDNWDVSKVTNMSYMFYRTYLADFDLSSWNTESLTDISYMFSGSFVFDETLTRFIVLDNWNTSKITNMAGVFQSGDIVTISLKNWVIADSTDLTNFCRYQTKLTSLDLSGWQIGSNVTTTDMFRDCYVLSLDNINMTGCSDETIAIITDAYNNSANAGRDV